VERLLAASSGGGMSMNSLSHVSNPFASVNSTYLKALAAAGGGVRGSSPPFNATTAAAAAGFVHRQPRGVSAAKSTSAATTVMSPPLLSGVGPSETYLPAIISFLSQASSSINTGLSEASLKPLSSGNTPSRNLHFPFTKVVSNGSIYDEITASRGAGGHEDETEDVGLTLDGDTNNDTIIRKEQIEAALHSKPQRGRKRANLNQLERVELTRTRNREHAKCTRIRKKARYEELLQTEKKLQAFLNAQLLQDERKAMINCFIIAREQGLRSSFENDCDASSTSNALEDIMEGGATFHYNGSSAKTLPTNDQDSAPSSLKYQLEMFDDWVVAKVIACLGKAVIPMLSLSIQGGAEEGIALNALHSGFIQVDVHVANLRLMRAVVQFDFADKPSSASPSSSGTNSCKISAVHWTTILDATENGSFDSIDSAAERAPLPRSSPSSPVTQRHE
jgi:hypothetical protein